MVVGAVTNEVIVNLPKR